MVGPGRLGTALTGALAAAGVDVTGPLGRGVPLGDTPVVLLCVPDCEIPSTAWTMRSGRPVPLVGHCSGATGLQPLTDAGFEAFSMHPLMTVTAAGADFHGVASAVDGSTERALRYATALAERLGMEPVHVAAEDRVAYHAAASIASNFLVTLEAAAERLAASAGIERRQLLPLVRATVENWAAQGPDALTGPVARGDLGTVARQRQAIGERAPDLLALFDGMVEATRALSTDQVRA